MMILAAFKSPSGKISTGQNHGDAFNESDVASIDDLSGQELMDGEGFLDTETMVFMSREQTKARFGFSCVEQMN
jgi:hypothetical protein